MTTSKHKKSILWITGIICGIGGLAALVLFAPLVTDHRSRVTSELAGLSVPPGCHETGRRYTGAGIDTNSMWQVDYACSSLAGPTYDRLTEIFQARGYHLENDSQISYWYLINYANNPYHAQITFNHPGSDNRTLPDPATLRSEPISGYHMNFSYYDTK